MSGRPLTARQIDVLGVVGNCGPVSARDVGEHHLPISARSARAALDALERRRMVSAVYTGSGVHGPARHYQITGEGAAALTPALVDQVGSGLASIDEARRELGREPWNLTETQRRQFREAHASATEQRAAELHDAADDVTIPRCEFSVASKLHLFALDMAEITCPDCSRTAYPDDLGEALDWALGHTCVTPGKEG